ncbi:hypothetical protein CAPTEDRAFT_196945 [Capitella teleta]|uniref:WSC domain-containing protein n=1 Tax=Capitella teleta TaxID=283909 RepID=R7TBU3_CAPTE|nr:hypothetical protein CAPTEDRAFT_196945 [Capitella teleta]|eukprot:ELT90957.1 hypothetical protein CAPTEDRAFT_196945 [Capitella teleta]
MEESQASERLEGATCGTGDQYVGCFRHRLPFSMPHNHFGSMGALTLTSCFERCRRYHRTYFGLTDGRQCMCASKHDYGRYGSGGAKCVYACSGNPDETCGGKLALQVYTTCPLNRYIIDRKCGPWCYCKTPPCDGDTGACRDGCLDGFYGDKCHLRNINECKGDDISEDCHQCINTPGDYECRCRDGFQSDEDRNCVVITEPCPNSFSLHYPADLGFTLTCPEVTKRTNVSVDRCLDVACRSGANAVSYRPSECLAMRCPGTSEVTISDVGWDVYLDSPNRVHRVIVEVTVVLMCLSTHVVY